MSGALQAVSNVDASIQLSHHSTKLLVHTQCNDANLQLVREACPITTVAPITLRRKPDKLPSVVPPIYLFIIRLCWTVSSKEIEIMLLPLKKNNKVTY